MAKRMNAEIEVLHVIPETEEDEKEKKFKFDVLRNKIDKSQLKVVFFLQDKETKKVLNAVICDVKS